MSAAVLVVVAVLAAAAAAAAEWLVLRAVHRRGVEALRARHQQQQLDLQRKLEGAKRQIGLIQQELNALKQRRDRRAPAEAPARPAVPTREELDRMLDAAPARVRAPADGFAETLPSPQYAHVAGSLFVR